MAKYSLHIDADSPAEIIEILSALTGATVTEAPAKPAKGKAQKAPPAPETTPVVRLEPQHAPAPVAEAPAAQQSTVTKEDCKALLARLIEKKGPAEVKELLTQVTGKTSLSAMEPADLPVAYAAIESALAGA